MNNLLTFNKLLISLYLSLNYGGIAFLVNCFESSHWKNKYVVIMKAFKQHSDKGFQHNPNWPELLTFIKLEMNYVEIMRKEACSE